MSPEQKEALARSAGYPSYDAMILFQQQRQMQRAPQTTSGIPGASMLPPQMREAASHAMDWHPAKIFQMISDKFASINNR